MYLSAWNCFLNYHQTSNINRTLVGNNLVDHSDVSWSIACWRCSNFMLILDLTPGFSGPGKDKRLGKEKCKTRWETFKFWDLVWLILEVWWIILFPQWDFPSWCDSIFILKGAPGHMSKIRAIILNLLSTSPAANPRKDDWKTRRWVYSDTVYSEAPAARLRWSACHICHIGLHGHHHKHKMGIYPRQTDLPGTYKWQRLIIINPLRAKFFWGNINIYFHFMSLLHIDPTQVLKFLPQVRPGLIYST